MSLIRINITFLEKINVRHLFIIHKRKYLGKVYLVIQVIHFELS